MSEDEVGSALREAKRALQAARTQLSVDQEALLQPVEEQLLAAVDALAKERERAAGLRAAEEQRTAELQREVRARDETLSIVGHELRNPISPVFLHVRTLLLTVQAARDGGSGHVDAAWLAPRLSALEQRFQAFVAVLDRILDVSRLSAGHVDLELAEVDLNTVVRDIVERFERDAAAARCELRVELCQPLTGMWDRLRLEQIVSNLLSNAIRYGAGAPIEIAVELCEATAQLRVRDHGIGIAPEDHARIFERFQRVGQRPRHGGFGVGLWVVKNLCHALGGSISLESAPSHGATFTVSLPRATPATRVTKAES